MAGWKSGFTERANATAATAEALSPLQKKIAEAKAPEHGSGVVDSEKLRTPSVPVDKKVPITVEVDGKTLVEREAAELFKFSGVGDFVKGVLIGAEFIVLKENRQRVMEFQIDDLETGRFWKVRGTWDINQKLRPSDIGSYVQIVYKGEDPNIGRGDNKLKLFAVAVEARKSESDF